MKRTSSVLLRLGTTLACCLGVLVALGPGSAPARTPGFSGSLHDFTASGRQINPQPYAGACNACHVAAHKGADLGFLWVRSLNEESGYYNQAANPNFVTGATLMCYDCHDSEVSYEPADPPTSGWVSSHEPQDIAQAGARVGYYENACGQKPGGVNVAKTDGSPTGGHYWKSSGQSGTPLYKRGDKIDCALCHDPHNAATGTNEAFFRTETWDGSTTKTLNGGGLKASTWNATTLPDGSRTGTGTGREMCASCHGFSDNGSQVVLFGVTVPKPRDGVTEHKKTAGVDTGVPCVVCHGHNQIAGCNECHGYPPMLTEAEGGGVFDRTHATRKYVENYPGGAGAHRRHKDALGSDIFKCELCHGPNPGRPGTTWHNESSGANCNTVTQTNVDIMGLTSYWGAGSSYNVPVSGSFTDPVSGDVYSFKAKGGPDDPALSGRCANLACHGYPPNTAGALNWDDKMVNDSTGAAVSIEICKWCHDVTPAKIGTWPLAPNVLGDNNGATSVWNTGTWGADVNGHGLASGNYEKDLVGEATRNGVVAANVQCAVCHDARYTELALPSLASTPVKPHFNSTNTAEKRLSDTINGENTIADNPDNTCLACHQKTGGSNSAVTQTVSHGNSETDGYLKIEPDSFTRRCRQCHEPHGRNWNGVTPNPRNLHMIGKWIDADNDGQADGTSLGAEAARVDSNATDNTVNIDGSDLPVIFKSTGGTTAAEMDDSWNDGYNDSQYESVCVVCHTNLIRNAGNPGFPQVGQPTLQGAGHLPVGTNCRACHKHGDTSTRPNKADDAFGPLDCFACHGTPLLTGNIDGVRQDGQYWPDGRGNTVVPAYNYSNDQAGAHRRHVEAIALKIFGETVPELVADFTTPNPTLRSKQKQIAVCAFCHFDPGGIVYGNHSVVDTAGSSAADRVDVLQGGSAEHYFKKFTTGAGPYLNRTNFADDTTGGAYSFVTDNCANLVCHNQNATPAAASTGAAPGWNTPPDWTPGANTKCQNTSCHAPSTYAQPLPAGNAHFKHVAASQKNYECRECHADNGANLQHEDGKVDMQNGATPWHWNSTLTVEGSVGGGNGFYNKDKSTSGTPTATAGDTGFAYKDGVYDASCIAIYCHGADTGTGAGKFPAADQGTNTTPQWGVASTAACGTCHGASSASPPGSLSHPKHAGAAAGQYAIRCQACHYGTTTDGATIASQTLHVNASAEVSFNTLGDSRVDATSSYDAPGDTVMGSGYGSCSSTYCHSRGNDRVAPYNDVPLSVPVAALPVWGAAGPLACSGCHGNWLAVAVDKSMPDYADGTPKANKHDVHNTKNNFSCQICHYPTTQVADTIADTSLHVNGSYEAGADAAGAALYQFTWASPNCNAVACHGGNGTITWATAGPYACSTCHGYVGGVETDTDVDDFAWAGATPTMSKIGHADYVADGGGHGDNTGSNKPNQPCSGCHDSSASHDTSADLSGTNPFRLVDQDSGLTGVQYSCSYTSGTTPCHTGSSPIVGPRTGLNIATLTSHTVAAMDNPGGYTAIRSWPGWSVNLSCANCHDPHGDGNLSMVNRSVYDKAAFPLPGPMPAPPTEQLALSFTDSTTGIGAGSFAWGLQATPNASGICQECHEDASLVSFTDGNAATISGANHPYTGTNPGDCSNCHRHDRAFRPTTCKDCHDNPPDPGINGGAGDDAPVIMSFYTVNGHGAKSFDPDGSGSPLPSRTVTCGDCHELANPDPSTHLTGVFETYDFPGSTFGAPNTNTSHLKNNYFGAGSTGQDYQLNFDNNCNKNIYCHKNPPFKDGTHFGPTTGGALPFAGRPDRRVANPKASRPSPYWTPWTINDISTDAPTATSHYAPCISCHDPHGTNPAGFSYCVDRPDGNYHMVRKDWCDSSFCNNCHQPE